MNDAPETRQPLRIEAAAPAVGAITAAASALSIFVMAHHPTGHGMDAVIVHTGMITLMATVFFGMSVFSILRGGALVLAGLTAHGIALGANIGAGTISGFLVGALAAASDGGASQDVFLLLRAGNQVLAAMGVYATSVALVIWGADLVSRNGHAARLAGLAGLALGVIPAAALATGALALDIHGALAIYAAHAAFTALVGVLMLRRAV
ncbi:hypothetical protein DDZ18_13575 [Marinicauda salina]|uniref:Uncharacterized protein n=1 Tax=Marinicauda salina TaxID=2135793 RepID=A0A2U2BR08_9PROT|nr:hypothetical protein [Marinicauda salina]PWE16442.1 hypothetical protein DDZ18_13575 [Marinicauda salina]